MTDIGKGSLVLDILLYSIMACIWNLDRHCYRVFVIRYMVTAPTKEF